MAPVKVLLIGATGETGRSIANGLLEAGGFVCNLLVDFRTPLPRYSNAVM